MQHQLEVEADLPRPVPPEPVAVEPSDNEKRPQEPVLGRPFLAQVAPLQVECGDFTLTIRPELKLDPFLFWLCRSFSLLVSLCSTFGESLTEPRLKPKAFFSRKNNHLFVILSRNKVVTLIF